VKIDIQSIDRNNFMVHQHKVGEHDCFLVQPVPFGTVWNRDNIIYRSSLWDAEGNPISLSFKKFFNLDEKPDLFPAPASLVGARLVEKLDGSTLIFSRYKGHTVIRTRGTIDARNQPNGSEINVLMTKYEKFISYLETQHTSEHSFVFEWLSPTNRIVIDYGSEPDMVLTAAIVHDDYSLVDQHSLNHIAKNYGLRRPKFYNYNSISDMKKAVLDMRDFEGICLYYNNEQNILKIKSAHYLFLHRAKSEISSIDKVIDVYMDWFNETKKSDYVSFFGYLTEKFDFEIANMARGHASRICDAMITVHTIMEALHRYANICKHLTRKEAAGKILQAYGSTGRAAIIFKILDGKPVGKDDYTKILYQVLK